MKKIIVNSFAKRQIPESPFSHYGGSWENLSELVAQNLSRAKAGYREGVLLVPVPPEDFYSGVVSLTEGCEMSASFVSRREGEKPRKRITAKGEKLPAKCVEIVLYSSDLLSQANDNEIEGGLEIISINASSISAPTPMAPGTMMSNHFGADGGTDTKMSAEEFEAALRESFNYWKDKAMCSV